MALLVLQLPLLGASPCAHHDGNAVDTAAHHAVAEHTAADCNEPAESPEPESRTADNCVAMITCSAPMLQLALPIVPELAAAPGASALGTIAALTTRSLAPELPPPRA